jgi:hypothetical protein
VLLLFSKEEEEEEEAETERINIIYDFGIKIFY